MKLSVSSGIYSFEGMRNGEKQAIKLLPLCLPTYLEIFQTFLARKQQSDTTMHNKCPITLMCTTLILHALCK